MSEYQPNKRIYSVKVASTIIELNLDTNRYNAQDVDPSEYEIRAVPPLQDVTEIAHNIGVGAADWPRFVAAGFKASRIVRLDFREILRTVHELINAQPLVEDEISDSRNLFAMAATYRRYSAWRFRRRLCLEDSVCALLFLRPFAKDLSLTIGVRDVPFLAHAWLESAGVVLNDEVGRVLEYTEICKVR